MKRLLLLLLILVPLSPLTLAASEKANTVLIHPGETVYARFAQKGKKLRLLSATKESQAQSQVVFTFNRNQKDQGITLTVVNHFPKDLIYKAEIRSLTLKRHMEAPVYPVVGGKLSTEEFPPGIEELALYDFSLDL